jgi:hypothetical protein
MKKILFEMFRVLLIALTFLFYFLPYFIWHFKMPKFYHEVVDSWKRHKNRKYRTF